MMKQSCLLVFQLLVSCLFIGAPLYGQEVVSGPELTIEVDQPDLLVTGPHDVYVTFSNVGGVDLKIEKAELIYPAAVESTRDSLTTNLLECDEKTAAPSLIVPKSSQRFFHCVFQRYERTWIEQLLDVSTFFFLPGKYRIQAVIEYSPAEVDTTPSGEVRPHRRFLRQTADVELKPPLMTLLRGSWIGCFLAALFITIRWSKERSAEPSNHRDGRRIYWRVAKFGFRVLATGLVSATIIILLLQRLSDIGLPLNVEVNDWVGGVIVGLIAYVSTDALYRRLTDGGGDANSNNRTPSSPKSDG